GLKILVSPVRSRLCPLTYGESPEDWARNRARNRPEGEDPEMARPPKPWYRKSKDAWYVCLDGKQVQLAKGKASKAEATRAFHGLMLAEGKAPPGAGRLTVAEVCDLFLEDVQRRLGAGELAPLTAEWYPRH